MAIISGLAVATGRPRNLFHLFRIESALNNSALKGVGGGFALSTPRLYAFPDCLASLWPLKTFGITLIYGLLLLLSNETIGVEVLETFAC